MVHMPDIFSSRILVEGGMKRVQLTENELSKYQLYEGDFIFARRSFVLEGVGKCCLIGKLKEPVAFESSMIRVTLKKELIFPMFALHYLESYRGTYEMLRFARQVAVSGIAGTDIKKYIFPLPPLAEQKKIAEILSTWDKAIELTQELVQAKTRRKKGLMQQLLTGKRRFGKGKWKRIEFGNFCNLSKKKYDPKKNGEIYKCIELEHLNQETGQISGFVTSDKQASTKNKFSKGQVLFGKLRPYLKKYAFPDFDGVCSSEIWVLDAQKKVCYNRYLFYLIQSHPFIQIANVTSGTKMPRSDWKFVSQYPFEVPVLKEQKKIAAVLTTCDKEIDLLTQKLKALKQQKKGLMQKLLTGEIRVNHLLRRNN